MSKKLYIAHSTHSCASGTSSANFTEPALFIHAILLHLCLHWDCRHDEIVLTGISTLTTAHRKLGGNTVLRVAYTVQYIGDLEGDVQITGIELPTPAYVGYTDLLDGCKSKAVHNNLIYELQQRAIERMAAGELP
jgi:hypothetical protein